MRTLSARGWRSKEPLDDVLTIEEPLTFKMAIDLLLDNNRFTSDELVNNLCKYGLSLNHDDIELLLGLDKDRLKPMNSRKLSIKLLKSNSPL